MNLIQSEEKNILLPQHKITSLIDNYALESSKSDVFSCERKHFEEWLIEKKKSNQYSDITFHEIYEFDNKTNYIFLSVEQAFNKFTRGVYKYCFICAKMLPCKEDEKKRKLMNEKYILKFINQK